MNPAVILAVMLHFAHARTARPGWEATAVTIGAVTQNRAEAAMLVTIAWAENTFVTDTTRGVPFGVTCCWRNDGTWTPERAARKALSIMRAGQGECHETHRAWIRYFSGACRIRPPAHHRESARHRQLRIQAHRYALRADRRYHQALDEFRAHPAGL